MLWRGNQKGNIEIKWLNSKQETQDEKERWLIVAMMGGVKYCG
jgi:hypothetical protein